eukprot:m.84575 g.84575  ORF g.84575 m.84575 type:complete len:424 (-) comp50837_c0_seq1:157-1428(-)
MQRTRRRENSDSESRSGASSIASSSSRFLQTPDGGASAVRQFSRSSSHGFVPEPNPSQVTTYVTTTVRVTGKDHSEFVVSFIENDIIGTGSFGKVLRAYLPSSNEFVAIKTVQLNRQFMNRELQFLQKLSHPNIIELKFFYITADIEGKPVVDGIEYIHLAMECMPETLHHYASRHRRASIPLPMVMVKLAMLQVFRALAFLHSTDICHRDLKPQNILISETTGVVKLCDLGSMKQLLPTAENISYICSRFYRAPELLFGASRYTCAVDLWAAGCTCAELLLAQPLFPGTSTKEQIAFIWATLGPTTSATASLFAAEIFKPDMQAEIMQIEGVTRSWSSVFSDQVPIELVSLIPRLLKLVPSQRVPMSLAVQHSCFDELRDPACTLPNGNTLPTFLFQGLPTTIPNPNAPARTSSKPTVTSYV